MIPGADGSVINKKSQDKVTLKIDGQSLNIGANGSNTVELSSNNTIIIGALSQEKVSFTLIPYETAAFDGVMGTDLMEKYVIEIDYGKKELRFYLPDTFQKDLSSFEQNNIYFPNNYLSIKSSVIIRGKEYKGFFGLDTGADDLLTISSPYAKKNDFVKKTKVIGSSTSLGSDGSTFEEPLVLMPEIRFSNYRLYNIFTNLSNATLGGLGASPTFQP